MPSFQTEWGTFVVQELRPLAPAHFNTQADRVGGSLVIEFHPSARARSVRVGLMQIQRPRQRVRAAAGHPPGPWIPFFSEPGTQQHDPKVKKKKEKNVLLDPVNGWAIDNEGADSPLFRMQQKVSASFAERNAIWNCTPTYAGAAHIAEVGGAHAGFWDMPARNLGPNVMMVMQDFDVVALALDDGPQPLVLDAGKVLGVISWGWMARRRLVAAPVLPAAAAAVAVERIEVIALDAIPRSYVSDDFIALCVKWNAERATKIPHVAHMTAGPPPVQPPAHGSLAALRAARGAPRVVAGPGAAAPAAPPPPYPLATRTPDAR